MIRKFTAAALCNLVFAIVSVSSAQSALAQNPFPVWINGANCSTEPAMQVFQYDADTYILRQSMCTNYEGNFIYLLFGQDKVLMEDTGASSATLPILRIVSRVIQAWLSAHGQSSIQLIVAHSHSHGDHIAHDAQMATYPGAVVVGTSVSAVQNFFGFTNWPTQQVTYDLGGRVLDVLAIPGHQVAHIAFYDRNTQLFLTGDTLYPGRLYISDFNTYVASVQRLVDFAAAHPVTWVMGTHIEMQDVPGQQFAFGSTYHPNEHVLQLSPDHLTELLNGVLGMQSNPHLEVHDDFIIQPL